MDSFISIYGEVSRNDDLQLKFDPIEDRGAHWLYLKPLSTPLGHTQSCFSYFDFEIRWIHLISWIRGVLHGYWNLLSMNNNLFTHNAFNYPWIMQIHFAISMHNAVSHFSYPWIVNDSMDNANEHFTYPWIINSIIHVQLDELV